MAHGKTEAKCRCHGRTDPVDAVCMRTYRYWNVCGCPVVRERTQNADVMKAGTCVDDAMCVAKDGIVTQMKRR